MSSSPTGTETPRQRQVREHLAAVERANDQAATFKYMRDRCATKGHAWLEQDNYIVCQRCGDIRDYDAEHTYPDLPF